VIVMAQETFRFKTQARKAAYIVHNHLFNITRSSAIAERPRDALSR